MVTLGACRHSSQPGTHEIISFQPGNSAIVQTKVTVLNRSGWDGGVEMINKSQ